MSEVEETPPPIRRVCHVIGSLDPVMGGLPKSAVALAAAQSLQGVETAIVFFRSTGGAEHIQQAYGHLPGFEHIRLYPLTPGSSEQIFARGLHRALEDFGPQLIHTHGLWEPLLMRAHRYALRKGIPYVIFPQSMLHPWQARHHVILKGILLNVLGWKLLWQAATFVHVLSEAEAAHWREAGYPKVRIIPNGVFPEERMEGAEPDLPGLEGAPFVCSLARLHRQKAPEILLEAFAELKDEFPDHKLVLAGPDYGMRSELETRAMALNCSDRVLLPGMLEGESKWAVLRKCECFCLPSRAEGFSLALLEAALAEAPCVISEDCFFEELVQAGAARETSLNPKKLAVVLREVLSHPEEAKRMGVKAGEMVRREYSWHRIATSLLEAYAE